MNMIDIGTVLNRFDDTVDEHELTVKEYGIRFITADGRLRTMRCRKNVKSPQQGLRAPHQARGKGRYHLKRNGVMLLHDLDIDEPRTVKVFALTNFRDHGSSTWLTIKH